MPPASNRHPDDLPGPELKVTGSIQPGMQKPPPPPPTVQAEVIDEPSSTYDLEVMNGLIASLESIGSGGEPFGPLQLPTAQPRSARARAGKTPPPSAIAEPPLVRYPTNNAWPAGPQFGSAPLSAAELQTLMALVFAEPTMRDEEPGDGVTPARLLAVAVKAGFAPERMRQYVAYLAVWMGRNGVTRPHNPDRSEPWRFPRPLIASKLDYMRILLTQRPPPTLADVKAARAAGLPDA